MIYLASTSPRRRELLDQIGLKYEVTPVTVDETPLGGESADAYVLRIASAKARAARREHPGWPVLGSDTTVELDGRILGKPGNRSEAIDTLLALAGRTHRVLTAVTLIGEQEHQRISESRVTLRPISRAEAEAYWESGEPADKAGGYAIQGLAAIFISNMSGSYSGIMGLPLYETAEILSMEGIKVLPTL